MSVPIQIQLPPSLDLPPHLSAHKYFLVCTLTVAAWDTLVLSPRTYRLFKSPGWPTLKILFNFLRIFMPLEFIVVAVAFFDTKWTSANCQAFYLFEPICTAILLAAASASHVIRIHAIYEKKRSVLYAMGGLFGLQVIVTAICCGFYRSVPLDVGQGCIAGPRHTWVGIYWLSATIFYGASFALAVWRSHTSLSTKPLSTWKLMLRDGLNLYGTIFIVNLANVLFWFIMPPTGPNDPIKTIVTSMAAVLTASMTMRIILAVRGPLTRGGTFAPSAGSSAASRTTHVISRSGVPTNISTQNAGNTYTLDDMRSKPEGDWGVVDPDGKSSVHDSAVESKPSELVVGGIPGEEPGAVGVKITIDREIGYDNTYRHPK